MPICGLLPLRINEMTEPETNRSKPFVLIALVAFAIIAVFAIGARFFRIPTNVAYVTEEEGGVSVIDLGKLAVINRIHPRDLAPRGLNITFDGKYLITANKDTSDAAVFDTRRLRLVRRIPIGENPEFVKIHPSGEWLFTSYEPGSAGGPPREAAPATSAAQPPKKEAAADVEGIPSHIVEFHISDWVQGRTFTAGLETEGIEFSRDGKFLIVANEAQTTLGVFDVASGNVIRNIDLKAYGIRPRGVKVSPQGNMYAVTMEASGTLFTMDADFNVTHSVSTAAKPYGVAFDRDGRRIFVAAAGARKLQVFATDSLQLLTEVPIGQRCWHFTFTPDDSKILLACGRSNDVYVIDAKSYQSLRRIDGFRLPWGIVTYPRAYGSLGLP
jgi:YVTN family beta-propeller protein